MKTINLPALNQVTLEDVSSLLMAIERNPGGVVSPNHMEKTSPIRTSKLSPSLKLLEQFGFVTRVDGRIKITMSGKDFCHTSLQFKKASIRGLFLKFEDIQRIVKLLQASATKRLHRSIISESFDMNAQTHVADSEILAFITWGQACELFDYDKKREEIFQVNPEFTAEPSAPVGIDRAAPVSARVAS